MLHTVTNNSGDLYFMHYQFETKVICCLHISSVHITMAGEKAVYIGIIADQDHITL